MATTAREHVTAWTIDAIGDARPSGCWSRSARSRPVAGIPPKNAVATFADAERQQLGVGIVARAAMPSRSPPTAAIRSRPASPPRTRPESSSRITPNVSASGLAAGPGMCQGSSGSGGSGGTPSTDVVADGGVNRRRDRRDGVLGNR
jgi:hypothetical protein